MPWRTILNSRWTIGVGGGLLGIFINTIMSFAPDAFWVHDNRQLLNSLITSQPLIQRDIGDLKSGMAELNVTIKELTVELQKRGPQKIILEKPRK